MKAHGSFRVARSFAVLATALLLALAASILAPATAEAGRYGDAVVVANRGSGDVSVIDTATLEVTTVDLPGEAEPMYVNHDRRNDLVFVGDRASNTVVALDDESYEVVASIPVGAGVFHQWYDKPSRQLWVVGDTSQTLSVINSDWLAVEHTINLPADLVARGGKPHDVFVKGANAFVSVVGLDDGSGVVLQYSNRTFDETGRITTGGDPHLFVKGNRLYVASQDGSSVTRYNAKTLAEVRTTPVPSAHGIYVTDRNEVLVTNIAGGGVDAVFELNTNLKRVRSMADTPFPTPHNITADNSRQAWVTHSGAAANQVSIIDLDRRGFGALTTVTVGTNPFGLGFVRG